MYSYFFVSDHALHFYALGGPDFVVGPDAPKAERNVLGVIKVGTEIGGTVMGLLKDNHEATAIIGGRYIHSVNALVGGVSKSITEQEHDRLAEIATRSIATAQFSIQLFEDVVLKNQAYVDLILGHFFTHQTYYMGLVDENNHINFYDGKVRVVDPSGEEFVKSAPDDYLDVVAEHIEPWTYLQVPFPSKKLGGKVLWMVRRAACTGLPP